jgi:hypothetical protein
MIQANVNLIDKEKEAIQQIMYSGYFPWYRAPYQTRDTVVDPSIADKVANPSFLNHVLMERHNDPTTPGRVSSDAYNLFYKIFRRWCQENQIKINIIHRANLNLITYNDKEFTVPHHDHTWPHFNWVMYLNTVEDAPTIVFNTDLTINTTYAAIENTAVCFEGHLHAHGFPRDPNEHRFVAVFTFS